MKILSVASNEASSALLKRTLTAQHHVVDVVTDGELGWTYAATFEYDAIVLEISLPKLDGITLCKRLRGEGYLLPIMFLTAQDSIDAKVQGLDAGADDYLVQPCNPNELMARLRALSRRSNNPVAPTLSWGDLTIDPCSCAASYAGRPIDLTTKEYDLLELFVRNSYQVFSSDEIIDRLWSSNDFPTAATVRSHLRRLRHKLAAAGAPPDTINTIHGRGYYLKPLVADPPFALASAAPEPPPLLAETTIAAPDWMERSRLLCVALDPQMLLAISNLAAASTTFASITTAEAYIATLVDTPLDRLIATVVVVNLDPDPTAVRTLEFLRHVKQRFPQWSILVLSATDRWQDRLAIVRARGKFLCSAGLSSARLGAAISSLLQPTATPLKVMVVDNDLDWLRGLPKLLQHWDLKVTTLADPQQFWLVLESVRPDVLILEFTLAQISGLDLCQVVRNDPLWQHLPILFLSSATDFLSQQAAFSIGADDYLCKPIGGGELAGRIRNRLARLQH